MVRTPLVAIFERNAPFAKRMGTIRSWILLSQTGSLSLVRFENIVMHIVRIRPAIARFRLEIVQIRFEIARFRAQFGRYRKQIGQYRKQT